MYGKVMCLAAISSDDPVSPLHKIILPFIIVLKTSEDGKKEVYLYLSWLDRKGWAFRFISLLATKRTASYIFLNIGPSLLQKRRLYICIS
jgi:hypothetical protein